MARKAMKTDGGTYARHHLYMLTCGTLYIHLSVEVNKKAGLLSRKSKVGY